MIVLTNDISPKVVQSTVLKSTLKCLTILTLTSVTFINLANSAKSRFYCEASNVITIDNIFKLLFFLK